MDARATLQLDFDANKVRALIARYLGIDVEQLTDEVNFTNDFELDSLDRLELLMLIEEEFSGVEFSDAAVDRIEVVGDLIRHIEITNKHTAHFRSGCEFTREFFRNGHCCSNRSSNWLVKSTACERIPVTGRGSELIAELGNFPGI
jgi:acyl carrier protein